MTTIRVSLVLALIMVACGILLARQKGPSPEELGSELAKAPSKVDAWRNPYSGQREALLAGEKLFKRNCAECHGEDGRGRDKAPDLHSPVIKIASPGRLLWFLKNGNLKEGMPSWSKLPDQQKWQLVTYLLSLQESSDHPTKVQ